MLPVPEDEQEVKAIADIRQHGLHIINVLEEGDLPGFVYSVGLWHSRRHPEIIIFGLDRELSNWILNEISWTIKGTGIRFRTGEYYSGFLEGHRITFLDVPKSHYREHVGWDLWLYGGLDFPLIQCVWPTTTGVYPWQEGASEEFRELQPILKETASG